MRIINAGDGYYTIVKGKESPQFFVMFVDHDSSSWSKNCDSAVWFKTFEEADGTLIRLKHRAKLRRERAGKGDGKP